MSMKLLGAVALSLLLAACADAGLRGGSGADPIAADAVAPEAGSAAPQTWEFLGLQLHNKNVEPHTVDMEGQGD